MKLTGAALICLIVIVNCALGQQSTKLEAPNVSAKTKLEAFEHQTGSVIVRGFTTIGSILGIYGGSAVSVEAREFTNATTGKHEFGVVVDVKEGGRLERENRSYVDYDEIDSLLRGIDYILKVDASATKMADFQADYHTKGDLTLSTFSTSGGIKAAITAGRIGGVDMIITKDDLQKFQKLIFSAKVKLDELRKPEP